MSELKVTSIQELQVASQGEIVRLPSFSKGQSFIARLRRPSMMKLVSRGKIPNRLLRAANTIFADKIEEEMDINDEFMKDLINLIDIFADSVFVEPTWKEIKDAGIELTDEQYMAIFNYTQSGVSQVEPFCEEQTDNQRPDDVADVQV